MDLTVSRLFMEIACLLFVFFLGTCAFSYKHTNSKLLDDTLNSANFLCFKIVCEDAATESVQLCHKCIAIVPINEN